MEYWKVFDERNKSKVEEALLKVVLKYLTPPPTSTDVERLFSTAGDILTNERNRLLPANLEKLLFLRENLPNVNFKY